MCGFQDDCSNFPEENVTVVNRWYQKRMGPKRMHFVQDVCRLNTSPKAVAHPADHGDDTAVPGAGKTEAAIEGGVAG